MRKSTIGKIRRVIAIVLIVLMSIESFAAIVSNSDGGAFVTKAEFEDLKEELNSQIDKYNESLSNKIDGYIANYLAGIGVKHRQIFEPIANYADINWVRKWYTYGSYITWTNTSTWTRTLDKWFEPFMDKMIYTRDDSINIKGFGGRFTGIRGWEFGGTLNFDTASGPIFNGKTDSQAIKPSQNLINCKYDEIMGRIVIDGAPFITTGSLHNRWGSSYKAYGDSSLYYSNDYGTSWIRTNSNNEYVILPFQPMEPTHVYANNWITTNNIEGDQVLNVTMVTKFNSAIQIARWDWAPLSWELAFEECYGGVDVWDGVGGRGYGYSTDLKTSSNVGNWSDPNAKIWSENSNGIHACQLEGESTQETDFVNMMLGSDSDKVVNIRRKHAYETVGSNEVPLIRHELSDWCTLPVTLKWLFATGKQLWAADDTTAYVTYPEALYKTIEIRIPYAERATLSEICGGKFYNNKTPLKFGEGLPLALDFKNTGDIIIEFDYSFARSFDSVPSTAKSIEVDLKRTNFLSKEDDYYEGIIGNATSGGKLKNVEINTADKHVKITIDETETKVGGELWLRLRPKDTAEGLKAKINNLSVTMLQN